MIDQIQSNLVPTVPRGNAYTTPLIYVVLAVALPVVALPATAQRYDLLIQGGKVMDGTGNPWFEADVAIQDGRIAAVGNNLEGRAKRTIDASGLVVCPGFIDLHSHMGDPRGGTGDRSWENDKRRAALNLVSQGITTVVVNQDGRGPVDIGKQRSFWKNKGHGPNLILLVGHNAVRGHVLGSDDQRPATHDEVDRMRHLVRQAFADGAWGMSSGLEYTPSIWSTTDELVALANEIAERNGVLVVHERSSGADPFWWLPSQHDAALKTTMLENILELIEVSEKTGAVTVATHIKARGANYWGSSGAMIRAINAARARGVNIYADQYPYNTSGSDGSLVLIPRWFLRNVSDDQAGADYGQRLDQALDDAEIEIKLRMDIAHVIRRRGGPENIVVMESKNPDFEGKTLDELSQELELDPVDLAFHLQLHGDPKRPGGVRLRSFSMSEADIEAFAAQPWCATATDGDVALPGDGPVHARFYGTFPRKIRHYAMKRGALTVENAVRSSTSLPAQILGLRDRGQIREGFHADLVVFNPNTIRDTATFENPHQYPEGVEYVLINGEFVVEDAKTTGALAGKVLTPGEAKSAPP